MEYQPRTADDLLDQKLAASAAVLVEGAKWCGKTTTAARHAQSVLYMQDPDRLRQNLEMADLAPSRLLAGDVPRLLDEWQLAPVLWDAVRFEADRRGECGQFVLTGSAVPPDPSSMHHTGTGRISRLVMRPMSLFESGDSDGSVSLSALFGDGRTTGEPDEAGGDTPGGVDAPGDEDAPGEMDASGGVGSSADVEGYSDAEVGDIARLVCRGGWPGSLRLTEKSALDVPGEYLEAVISADVSRVDGVTRDAERVRQLLRACARATASQTSLASIRRDMLSADSPALSEDTVQSYAAALRKIFVLEDSPAWNPNLRSKTAIRTSATRYFTDPSLAVAALGAGPDALLADLETLGLLFENLCVRDLRVYAQAAGGEVCHYRDRNGLECDAVVRLADGRYGLVEVKLGGEDAVEAGAVALLKLARAIDTQSMPSPSFRMVVTAKGGYARCRADGVLVVPITCLGA